MIFSSQDLRLASLLIHRLRSRNLRLAGAESCTGGLTSALLTAISGSSDVFDCAFITYSYESKTSLLDIPASHLLTRGAVDGFVAKQMATNVLQKTNASLAYAITGVAGPGASERRPAGLVFIATAKRHEEPNLYVFRFNGNRDQIRLATMRQTVTLLL